jgi:hypothetical protein
MRLQRFDQLRLSAVHPRDVGTRSCADSLALVRACSLGAGPANRPWWQPWQAARLEWPYGVLHVRDLEVARRACLLLDGSWAMADAPSGAARLRIRLAALAADAAWWRALRPGDAWDAGVAPSVEALLGFWPRRATLIVLEHTALSQAGALAQLSQLEQQASRWPRAVRLVVAGGAPPAFARPVAA